MGTRGYTILSGAGACFPKAVWPMEPELAGGARMCSPEEVNEEAVVTPCAAYVRKKDSNVYGSCECEGSVESHVVPNILFIY